MQRPRCFQNLFNNLYITLKTPPLHTPPSRSRTRHRSITPSLQKICLLFIFYSSISQLIFFLFCFYLYTHHAVQLFKNVPGTSTYASGSMYDTQHARKHQEADRLHLFLLLLCFYLFFFQYTRGSVTVVRWLQLSFRHQIFVYTHCRPFVMLLDDGERKRVVRVLYPGFTRVLVEPV